jgi:HK97 gp10 family phage protein
MMSNKVTGFRELDQQLAKLAAGVPEDRQRQALHAGGEIIAAEMRRLAPFLTGNLRDSILVADDRDARIYGKVNLPGMSVFVGPAGSTEDGDVYYAKFQEFGWLDNPGTPFARPAIATKRPEAERVVMSMLRRDVLELAR